MVVTCNHALTRTRLLYTTTNKYPPPLCTRPLHIPIPSMYPSPLCTRPLYCPDVAVIIRYFVLFLSTQSYDYENCSCITEAVDIVYSNSTANSGLCESTCILIVPTLILFIVSVTIAFISSIPYQYYILRLAIVVVVQVHVN